MHATTVKHGHFVATIRTDRDLTDEDRLNDEMQPDPDAGFDMTTLGILDLYGFDGDDEHRSYDLGVTAAPLRRQTEV